MQVVVGIALLLFGGGFFARQVRSVPQSAWAGPRTAGQRQRGASRPRSVRQEIRLIREKARWQDWTALRAHERKTGTGHAAVVTAAKPAAATPGATATVVAPGGKPIAAAVQRLRGKRPANGKGQPVPGDISSSAYGLPDEMGRPHLGDIFPRSVGRPAWKDNPPSHSNGSPGRNTAMPATSGNAVEQLVEGVNQIHAHAQAGGMPAKQGAVKASHEGSVRFAQMAAMLSRQMSEPGMNYGPEITEPIAKAGTHLQAAAMAWSEADAALTSLANMTVGDLAQSSRQAPHHTELSENGSR